MKTEYQIIAVDFDGTLCTDCFPKIGQPNTALIELLKGLRRQGRQIILWTCRCGNQLEEAVEWCRKWELEFDAVNENLPEIIERYGSDGRKIYVYNLPLIVGSFLAIGGLLWGLLLVLNNDNVEKRTKHRYCSDSI